MKNRFFFLMVSLIIVISCGEDNDDFILPEDVSNINFDIGLTFGVVKVDCTADCVDVYKWTNAGVFSANTSTASPSNPNNFTFFDCPISQEARFVSQANNVRNIPRALRDVPKGDLVETIANTNFPEVYIVEYTLKSGDIKTIQFFNGSNPNKQISQYFNTIISVINSLNDLNTDPTPCTVI